MTIQELFEEYAGAYREVDMCDRDFCKVCPADKERMEAIIQEVETLVRKETIGKILYDFYEGDWVSFASSSWTTENTNGYIRAKEEFEKFLKEFALSKGVILD